MSQLIVEVKKIDKVRMHPNADKLDIVEIGGWQVCSQKGSFKEGDLVDISAVTKGYGFEGPVKRWGVKTIGRKNQMMARHVGSIGNTEPGKTRPSVPQSGQRGFQTRVELNKRILKIANGFGVDGGFINYGNVKGDCVIVEGCMPGPKKRLIRMRVAIRPKHVYPVDIKTISTESKQGI